MDSELGEGFRAEAPETVDLTGLDDENVPGARLELLTFYGPEPPAGLNELYFVVGVTMGSRSASWLTMEEKIGDVYVALIGANEVEGATPMRQLRLSYTKHAKSSWDAVVICFASRRTISSGELSTDDRARVLTRFGSAARFSRRICGRLNPLR
jgi:hypothetical protein